MPENQFFANIILPLPLPKLYTYGIPLEIEKSVQVGKRVIVQFGKKKFYSGIVQEIHKYKPEEYEIKNILSVLDDDQVVNAFQFELWNWISAYYCCTLGEVFKAALPSGLKLESETKISLNPDFTQTAELNEEEYIIINFLENNPIASIFQLSSLLGENKALRVIKTLLQKEVICIEEKLKTAYIPKLETYVLLNENYKNEKALNDILNKLNKAPKQEKILIAYLSICNINDPNSRFEISKKELLEKSNSSSAALDSLVKKEVFQLIKRKVDRIQFPVQKLNNLKELNPIQIEALKQVNNLFNNQDTILLHGVTSSGKTEIYIHLIQQYLDQEKQVLYLLPEIALTSQIITRLQAVFGDKVGVYHSKFSDNERVEVYNKVNKKEASVILGVRSSIFLPFINLGLIIIDEEHENSYKQYDPAPRYNARDTAIMLGKIHQAKILLGTATPSIESYFNTKIKKYGLVELNERYQNIKLPEIIVASTRDAKHKKQMKAELTPQLYNEIKEALDKKEQIILFQNRRGFSPYLECSVCGWIPYCNNCDVSLTYHKHLNRLICHYCGFSYVNPNSCKACGSAQMEMKGFGTEKIESDIAILFPNTKIARMDLDSTRKKHAYDTIISNFENGKIDLLIGTQMVTKGLDFDNVSLVGILNADNMLNFPDFRAFERSYHLMAQVSGRAGRKNKQGKVIIQTANPNHPIINFVKANKYHQLYESQLEERKKFNYPPFYRLIIITVKHKKRETLDHALKMMTNQLKKQFKENVLGPQAPLVSRIQNWYLKNYILKIDRNKSSQQAKNYLLELSNFIKSQPNLSNLQIVIDVDPI